MLNQQNRHLHGRREESVLLFEAMQDLPLVDVHVAQANVRDSLGPQDGDVSLTEPLQAADRRRIGEAHHERQRHP